MENKTWRKLVEIMILLVLGAMIYLALSAGACL